jgi:hypothetical protein
VLPELYVYKKLPINYAKDYRHLLSTIFDKQDYEDKYEDINRYLLKKERLYKSKELNIKIEKEWKY